MAWALEFWEQIQAPHGIAFTAGVRALIEVDAGLVTAAGASAERGVAVSQAMSDREWEILSLGALGRLELALGNAAVAGEQMRELPARLFDLGYNEPVAPVWTDAIEGLLALGDVDRASAYLDRHEGHARRIANPLALARAGRCRGLLTAAQGEVEAASNTLERSVAELEALPYPLEHARTLLCLGSVHRKAKRKGSARDALEQAVRIFEGLGARLWSARGEEELSRISGRRRSSAGLTETEERVASLAARGRSNRQIASELFMSVHTVGAHLSRVYQKLGIGSRAELSSHLDTTTSERTIPADQGRPGDD